MATVEAVTTMRLMEELLEHGNLKTDPLELVPGHTRF